MTQFCESCHTANRDRAKYCRGCAGRLTGLRAAPDVVTEPMGEGRPQEASMRAASLAPRPTLPGGLDRQVVVVLMLVVLSFAVFLFWYLGRTATRSAVPTQTSAAVHRQQAPSTPATLPMSMANAAPVAATAVVEAPHAPMSKLQEVQPEAPPVAPAQAGGVAQAADGLIAATDTASATDEAPREELITTDNRRSARATHPRSAGAAASKRPTSQGFGGAARTSGSTRRCDRYNPFGEALC